MIRSRDNAGFTLIELMMVVAIIGVVCAIAIPNFLQYQARSRRSEAYTNIAAIVRAQKSLQAERDVFHDSLAPWPDYTLNGGLGTTQQTWDDDSRNAFAALGWEPEGPVYYSYETNTSVNCDGCTACFTATAYGNVDGDASPSAVMYVHPAVQGGVQKECKALLFGFGTPTRLSGAPVYEEVEVNRQTDEY
jgi:type IV pilus assembly protein PilA